MTIKLSDKAKQHKKDYNAEYVKQTKGAAQRKWDLANQKRKTQKTMALWSPQDNDIIDHLKTINNFSAYIKSLIRKDMKNK